MRIVRFLSGSKVYLGREIDATSAFRIDGNVYGVGTGGQESRYTVTREKVQIDKLLS